MKYLGLLVVALVMSACYTVRPPTYTSDGDVVCSSDYQCPEHYYCGFKKINSYAVCKWGGWDYQK